MITNIPNLDVCLNNNKRRYPSQLRNPLQNWRELGLQGTRQEIIAAYGKSLERRYSQGDIKPQNLIEAMDNIEPCRCPAGKHCTTTVLEQFIEAKLEHLTNDEKP